MMKHIETYPIVARETVKSSENLLNATATQLARVMRVGSDFDHQDRVK